MLFSAADYAALAAIVFRPDYPGNATARGVVEAPNGDGYRDEGKRYAHVSSKNLHAWLDAGDRPRETAEMCLRLLDYLDKAHARAIDIAFRLGVPHAFLPAFASGALRVLEYPADTGSVMHTDKDLFTVNLYRNTSNPGLPAGEVHGGDLCELLGVCPATPHDIHPLPVVQRSIVYFAVPDHAAVLPTGETVGSWIDRHIATMRVPAAGGVTP
jgi:hypothetical protein